jgi:hypothetical protein
MVGVRDSKDPDGTPLHFSPAEVAAFIKGVKRGEFDGFGIGLPMGTD